MFCITKNSVLCYIFIVIFLFRVSYLADTISYMSPKEWTFLVVYNFPIQNELSGTRNGSPVRLMWVGLECLNVTYKNSRLQNVKSYLAFQMFLSTMN
jgi:hypothetical protein